MLWSPNIGIAYPFNSGQGAPAVGTEDFNQLDTNGDGVLNGLDDPYTPYYPGDEYVDWAGVSLYWYPYLTTTNIEPPANFFSEYLSGSGTSVDSVVTAGQYTAAVHDFYTMFAVNRNKPIALSESGSPYVATLLPSVGEATIKRSWYQQILSQTTLSKYPKLKAYLNFEEKKQDDLTSFIKDWSLMNNATLLAELKADLPTISTLTLQGPSMSFTCDGSVSFSSTSKLKKRGLENDL
ncbi:hypothetical protein HK096_008988 [Nowakowskiella sp. JEL0078]|nr:hypothetical protein HK096_008988 [Nowakowskiella sp. JEL0078]